jgi:hypothetical protein
MKQLGLFGQDKPLKEVPPADPGPEQLSMFSDSETVQFGVTTARPQAENRSYSMPGGLWDRPPADSETDPILGTPQELV